MVDIDGEVVDFCKKYLASWHQNSFDDPRSEVLVADAKKFVEEGREPYDVILSDLPTPIEAGPAYLLYTLEFYRKLRRRLKPGGIFALQAGSGNLIQMRVHQVLHSTLRRVFPKVWPYYAHVPSFDVPWAFLMCGGQNLDPLKAAQERVDGWIRRRVRGGLRFYDGMTHEGLFRVPKHIRQALAGEKRMITVRQPIYFYK